MRFLTLEAFYIILFFSDYIQTEISPGSHVCSETENYKETVMVRVAEQKKERQNICWWRGTCYKLKTVFVDKPRVVTKTRTVLKCCAGYTNRNSAIKGGGTLDCVPVCSAGCINGICTAPDICTCSPGFHGIECGRECSEGFWGINCLKECRCTNSGICNKESGCNCKPGWRGDRCDLPCQEGYYGHSCKSKCNCDFTCNHETGACITTTTTPLPMTTTTYDPPETTATTHNPPETTTTYDSTEMTTATYDPPETTATTHNPPETTTTYDSTEMTTATFDPTETTTEFETQPPVEASQTERKGTLETELYKKFELESKTFTISTKNNAENEITDYTIENHTGKTLNESDMRSNETFWIHLTDGSRQPDKSETGNLNTSEKGSLPKVDSLLKWLGSYWVLWVIFSVIIVLMIVVMIAAKCIIVCHKRKVKKIMITTTEKIKSPTEHLLQNIELKGININILN